MILAGKVELGGEVNHAWDARFLALAQLPDRLPHRLGRTQIDVDQGARCRFSGLVEADHGVIGGEGGGEARA